MPKRFSKSDAFSNAAHSAYVAHRTNVAQASSLQTAHSLRHDSSHLYKMAVGAGCASPDFAWPPHSTSIPTDRGTLEISGANLMYEGARVKTWMLGRDVNPAGRGDGAYYAQGAFSIGRVRPYATTTPVGGWGNSVNNGCGGCGDQENNPSPIPPPVLTSPFHRWPYEEPSCQIKSRYEAMEEVRAVHALLFEMGTPCDWPPYIELTDQCLFDYILDTGNWDDKLQKELKSLLTEWYNQLGTYQNGISALNQMIGWMIYGVSMYALAIALMLWRILPIRTFFGIFAVISAFIGKVANAVTSIIKDAAANARQAMLDWLRGESNRIECLRDRARYRHAICVMKANCKFIDCLNAAHLETECGVLHELPDYCKRAPASSGGSSGCNWEIDETKMRGKCAQSLLTWRDRTCFNDNPSPGQILSDFTNKWADWKGLLKKAICLALKETLPRGFGDWVWLLPWCEG